MSSDMMPSIQAPSQLITTTVPDDVMIQFDDVVKTYKLYRNDRERFMSIFWSRKKRRDITRVNAVNHLSFQVKRGEGVAFLGRNGAGKSTTLKMVTGVTYPTSGEVTVKGHVSALLELTAGFDSQLSGRENIHLRAQALGWSREETEELEPKIVDFADLGVYIDQPVRTYSSGMKSRLGFGFAVSSMPEILVVDEALSVGDKAFKEKCLKRVREIMEDSNVTVLFVTHASSAAKEFCTRGIVLDHGREQFSGPIDEATAYYEENF
ncbi:MAG: ABC transporter ATP-binding protein [Eggerthellaceae bacterium]|jgi:teichoic acid transport system ATP-binding protein